MRQVLVLPEQMGALLRGARKRSGLSQQAMAGRLGISQSRMSHIELNPGTMSLEQLLSILAILDLEMVIGSRGPADYRVSESGGEAEW